MLSILIDLRLQSLDVEIASWRGIILSLRNACIQVRVQIFFGR
jgi:hypothetical protein